MFSVPSLSTLAKNFCLYVKESAENRLKIENTLLM
jgi:hypothetical protein